MAKQNAARRSKFALRRDLGRGMRRFFGSLKSSEFFRQSSTATFWNFVGMAIVLVNGIITSRLLAPSDRGALALALTVSSLSYLLSSLGTNVAVRVFQPRQPWASFKTYFHLSAKLLVVDAVVVILIALSFTFFGVVDFSESLALIVLLGVTTFVSSQLLDVLNALGLVSRSAFINIVGHFGTLATLGLVYFFGEKDQLNLIFLAYLAGFLTRVLLLVFALRRGRVPIGTVAPDRGRALVKEGVRFWGINLGQTLTFRADQIVLGLLSTTYALGIYTVATTPASLMQVVSNSVGQMTMREAASGQLTTRRLARAAGVAFFVTATYSVVMWIVAPVLVPFIFGADYVGAVPIVRILLCAELALSPYLVIIRALAGFNRPFMASVAGIAGLPVLIVSMVALVPQYGVIGAAYAVVIAYVFMLTVAMVGVIRALQSSQKG